MSESMTRVTQGHLSILVEEQMNEREKGKDPTVINETLPHAIGSLHCLPKMHGEGPARINWHHRTALTLAALSYSDAGRSLSGPLLLGRSCCPLSLR